LRDTSPGKKFCRSCGAALTPESASRFASPESYIPKHLAEKILEYRHGWSGKTYYRQLRIDSLAPASAGDLAGRHLGSGASLAALKTMLGARTGDSPRGAGGPDRPASGAARDAAEDGGHHRKGRAAGAPAGCGRRPGVELQQGLQQLRAAEFLNEARLFPDREHTFNRR
jgi:hypothetical protein